MSEEGGGAAAVRRRTTPSQQQQTTPHEEEGKRVRRYTLGKHYDGQTISIGADLRMLLRMVNLLFTLVFLAVGVYIISINRYDLTFYTYWNYTLITLFLVLLCIALWIEKWLLTFLVLFVWPMVFGSAFLVMVSILLIIKENPSMLFKSIGEGDDLGVIHTGDFFVHVLPALMFLSILISGWYFYVRAVLGNALASITNGNLRTAYLIYWIAIPMVPFLIYSSIWSPSEKYPTGVSDYILWGILVLVDLLGMLWLFFVFTLSANVEIESRAFWTGALPKQEEAAFDGSGSTSFRFETPAFDGRGAPTARVAPLVTGGGGGGDESQDSPPSAVVEAPLIGSQIATGIQVGGLGGKNSVFAGSTNISLAEGSTMFVVDPGVASQHYHHDATNFNTLPNLKGIRVMRCPEGVLPT